MNGDLKPRAGDVGMYRADGRNPFVDFMIQTSSFHTHCSFFVSPNKMIEANRKGVVYETYSPELKHIEVWRPPEGACLTSDIERSIKLAEKHLGDPYSIWQGVLAGLFFHFGYPKVADKIDHNWNCSEYVAYILEFGLLQNMDLNGIPIQYTLPDHIRAWMIANSWKLIIQGDSKRGNLLY